MSKIEQIEEMANIIKMSLDGLGSGTFNFTGFEISTMFAKALYNAGYRKVPEGAMILTRAELDALNNYEKCRMQNAECRVASEVAREVFEEIEAVIERYINILWYTMEDVKKDLVELKKKYTEEKHNGTDN